METWLPVVGYVGYYEVSDYGRVRSLFRHVTHSRNKNFTRPVKQRLLAINDNGNGYKIVYLYKNGGKKVAAKVHRLVAEAFLPNPKGLPVVDHIDHHKSNNRIENLRWVTQEENVAYRNKPVEMVDVDGSVICVCKSANWIRNVLGIRADYVLYGQKESLNGIKFRFKL